MLHELTCKKLVPFHSHPVLWNNLKHVICEICPRVYGIFDSGFRLHINASVLWSLNASKFCLLLASLSLSGVVSTPHPLSQVLVLIVYWIGNLGALHLLDRWSGKIKSEGIGFLWARVMVWKVLTRVLYSREIFKGERSIRVITSWRKLSRNAKTYHRWIQHAQILWRKLSQVVLKLKFMNVFSLKGFLCAGYSCY